VLVSQLLLNLVLDTMRVFGPCWMSMVLVPRMERENLQPSSKMLIFLRKRIGWFWGTLTFTGILRTEIGKWLISMTCSFSIAPLVIWACLRFLFKGESTLGPICSIPPSRKIGLCLHQ
jgi:hypothetical protein